MYIDMEILITLFYILFAFNVIYPPTEFISAGLTIPQIFSSFLGSENEAFIQYHIRRTLLTMLIHSCLPLGYLVCLFINDGSSLDAYVSTVSQSYFWRFFYNTAIAVPLLVVFIILKWSRDGFTCHPIPSSLCKFVNEQNDWMSVAVDINEQYRSVDKICVQTNNTTKVIATNAWIIKVSIYKVYFAHQSDANLVVNKSDTHNLPASGERERVQYLNIEVKSARADTFNVRLNALDFKDFEEKVSRPITIVPNVTFHKTRTEQFVEIFRGVVENNPKYYTTDELDLCLGCMQIEANVKLTKKCVSAEPEANGQPPRPPCTTCYCRPLWCVDCMARWYASRQDQERTDGWLSSTCFCPVCRSAFCMLDVCLIEPNVPQ